MRSFALALLAPLALAAPAKPSIPELSVNEWSSIQSGVFDGLRGLSKWSWTKAEEIAEQIGADATSGDEALTIWQQLKADPHSFSRLVKVMEFEGKAYKYLDDKDLQQTFFAPNNDALKPPEDHHHHHHHDDDDDVTFISKLTEEPSLATLCAVLDTDPYLAADQGHHHDGDDDDDEKKKRRKEIFRKIAGYVLQYHGIAKAYNAQELAQNSTFPTVLKAHDGSYGGLHRRIKVEKSLLPPSLKINFYAKVLVADIKARNGYLHTLDHPLLPPPSVFEAAFLFPDFFSTATSAVQHTDNVRHLDWSYDHDNSKPGKPAFKGNPLVTFFLPTNGAFQRLPPKLKFYLFSPFGERALSKLLAYHGVPYTLFHTEFLHVDKNAHEIPAHDDMVESFNFDDSVHKELDLQTALKNATIHVEVSKTKVLPIEGATKITLKVNGQYAEAIDVPARNGAFHVIGKVLVPPHHHHDHDGEDVAHMDDWNNWEDWFPAWAAQV